MAHTETIVVMRQECLRMGLKVLPPDINESHIRFAVPAPGQVRYGLGAIRGVGEGALQGILDERDREGRFRDLFDFCRRIDLKRANKRVLEALIGSGSLDCFNLSRASLMATLPKALGLAEQAAHAADSGQEDLFGGGSDDAASAPDLMPEAVPDWSQRQTLEKERETLGFYLSGHPIDAYSEWVGQICSGPLTALIGTAPPPPARPDAKPVWQPRVKAMFAAWVTDLRFFKGDKSAEGRMGRASYKLTLDDQTAQISAWIDADRWAQVQSQVKVEQLCFVIAELGWSPAREGRASEPRLYHPEFLGVEQVLREYALRLNLRWNRPAADVPALRRLLADARDRYGVPIMLSLETAGGVCEVEFDADWRVRPSDGLLQSLSGWLGADCVKVQFRKYVPPVVERRSERTFASAGGDDE